MDLLDTVYFLMLVLSIPFGHIIKLLPTPFHKKICCLLGGLVIVLSLVGYKGMLHSFVTIFGNYVIVKVLKSRSFHYVSLVFTFAYLLFYRCCFYLGFPVPPKHSNAVQLLVTIRMINLAFELHTAMINKHDNDEVKEDNKRDLDVTLFDFYVYGYCYIGLMTGPFYTFNTFCDMLRQEGRQISTVWPALRNLKYLPILCVVYLVVKAKYPLQYLESDECLQHSNGLFHILPVMFFTYNWYRWRYLIGWKLAESMCMTAGVGAYPFECKAKSGRGPTEQIPIDFDPVKSARKHNGDTHDFTTIHNIDVLEIEGCNSMRFGIKAWNKTVQWWMVHHVYKNLPFKSNNVRLCLLMAISAYWHGIYSGYYLAFAMAIPPLFAEALVEKAMKPYLTSEISNYIWRWVKWFAFFRYLDFISVPFMFLKFSTIWKIWSRVYFYGLFGTLSIIILSFLIPKKHKDE